MEEINLDPIIEQAYQVVEKLIDEQDRYSQPFRDRFEHTKRVLNWAKRIHQHEGGDLGIITLAVLFHDSGWSYDIDHALIGAELAEKFLVQQGVDRSVIDRVTSAAQTHNKRLDPTDDLPIENLIVMDADILDELGVTTLVWDSMATAIGENPSYTKALERNMGFFNGASQKLVSLQTKTGKKFYLERIAIWKQCLDHLSYELGESDELTA